MLVKKVRPTTYIIIFVDIDSITMPVYQMLYNCFLNILILLDYFFVASNNYKNDEKKFKFWWLEFLTECTQSLSYRHFIVLEFLAKYAQTILYRYFVI